VLATAVLLHLGTNLINDAADYWKGVDRPGSTGGSGLLTSGQLSPRTVYRVGLGLLGLAALAGGPVIVARGWPVALLGGIGALGGYAYTAGPAYKYRGLGDAGVFLLMGPMLVAGAFFAITGHAEPHTLLRVALASLPIGLLVVAILAVNNYRDFDDDAAAGITTLAHVLGRRRARVYTIGLFVAALCATVAIGCWGLVPPAAAAGLVAFAPAIGIVRDLARPQPEKALLVERTAKVHALFGALSFAGLLAHSLWS
jgi:1,4-dihydroxy-2-naphthoate octaprenyltransferase